MKIPTVVGSAEEIESSLRDGVRSGQVRRKINPDLCIYMYV